jgi:hypothetical protein
MHASVILRFEDYWFKRDAWSKILAERVIQELREGKGLNLANRWSEVTSRAFAAIFAAASAEPRLADRVFELNFDHLLDRLLFLRDGINRFNGQNIAGALDSVLEYWPHYTETVCAVASAYGHKALLARGKTRHKILRNLRGGEKPPVAQCRDFDRLVALLCPEASHWLRSSLVVHEAMGPRQLGFQRHRNGSGAMPSALGRSS